MKFDFKSLPIITEKMVGMMQIKLLITIHQINGQSAHNTYEEEDEDQEERMQQRHDHPFLPL